MNDKIANVDVVKIDRALHPTGVISNVASLAIYYRYGWM